MKKFIKGRWFPLSVAVAAVLVIAFTLFFCGFRITYAPALESSWDAISAVASWVSALVSLLAVWAAIQISKKIAEEQNNVAEKTERKAIYFAIKEFSEQWAFYQTGLVENHIDIILLVKQGALDFVDQESYEDRHRIFESYTFYFSEYKEAIEQLIKFYTKIYVLCQAIHTVPGLDCNAETDLKTTMKEFFEFYNSPEFKNIIPYMEKILELPQKDSL